MFNIGPGEFMLLAILALLLFGPKRLPEIGKATGEAIAAFKNASRQVSEDVTRQIAAENAKTAVPSEPTAALPEPAHEHPPAHQEANAAASEPEAHPVEHNATSAV